MPSLEKLQISEATQTSSLPSTTSRSSSGSPGHSSKDTQSSAPNKVDALEPQAKPHDPHILLVDDNALNLKLLGAFFKKHGYRDVKQAKNGKEAVEIVKSSSHDTDIIFMVCVLLRQCC